MIVKPDQKQQAKYLEAIEWLVSGSQNVGSGRTYLLAKAFVKTAVRNIGQNIIIFDHHPTLRCPIDILGPDIWLAARRMYPAGSFTFRKRSVRFNGFNEF